jgi:outer membrane protein assembly factor BamB
VYVGASSGNIYALAAKTGQQVWTDNVGSAIPAPDEQNVSQPLTGMAIAEGTLVIAAGAQLVAYTSALAGPK